MLFWTVMAGLIYLRLEIKLYGKDESKKNGERATKKLAIAYVQSYCIENNLSVEKLQEQRFILSCNECAFAQPSDVKPNGLINDGNTMPKVTLIIKLEDGKLEIIETEYTKEFLENE